jgi:DNA-binding SARP family transcriptional activator
MHQASLYIFAVYTAIFIYLSLVVHVLTRSRRRAINLAFTGFASTVTLYFLLALFLFPPPDAPLESVEFALRLRWSAGVLLPVVYFHVLYFYFPPEMRGRLQPFIPWFYGISLLAAILVLATDVVVSGPRRVDPGLPLDAMPGPGMFPFFIFVFLLFLLMATGLILGRKRSRAPLLRRQIGILVVLFFLFAGSGIIGMANVFGLVGTGLIWLGNAALILSGFVYGGLVVQYGSFTGRPTALYQIFVSVVITLLGIVLLSATTSLDRLFAGWMTFPLPLVTPLVLTALVVGFPFFQRVVTGLLDRWVGSASRDKKIVKLRIDPAEILDPELLRQELLAALSIEVQASGAFLAEVVPGAFIPGLDLSGDLPASRLKQEFSPAVQVAAIFGQLPLTVGQRLPVPEPFTRSPTRVNAIIPERLPFHDWYGLAMYCRLSGMAMPDTMLAICNPKTSLHAANTQAACEVYAYQLELAQQILHLDRKRQRALEEASGQESAIRRLEDRIQALVAPDRSPVESLKPAPLYIRTLGGLEVSLHRHPVPESAWEAESARALLAYLLWKGSAGATTAELVEKIWAGRSEDVDANTIYVTVNRLRKVLEPELERTRDSHYILSEHGRYRFNFEAEVWLDVEEFQRLAESPDLDDQRRAVEIYRGPYLADVDWALPPDVEAFRRSLENQYLDCLRRLIAAQPGVEDDLYLEKFLQVEPLDEAINFLVVERCIRRGRYDLALSHLRRYREALEQVGVEPSTGMRQLMRRVEQHLQQK